MDKLLQCDIQLDMISNTISSHIVPSVVKYFSQATQPKINVLDQIILHEKVNIEILSHVNYVKEIFLAYL